VNFSSLGRRAFRWSFPIAFRGRTFRVYLFCHGIPERSFKIRGYTLPICSRCTGVVLGSVTFILDLFMFSRSIFLIMVSLLLVAPLAVDGVTQALGRRLSDNRTRFFTGFLAGSGIALLAVAI